MSDLDDLFLHEQLLLLALNDEKGTMQGQSFELGAAGAMLAELLLAGRIALEETGKRRKKRVVRPADGAASGDPLLDEALQRIRTAKRPEQPVSWVSRISRTKRLRHRIAERLRHRGILGRKEGRVLLIFSRALYPTMDPAPERELTARIREAVLGEGEVAPRTAVMTALAKQLDLLRYLLTRAELKQRKQRLKELESLEAVSSDAREAVAAVREAIAAAAAAVTAATSA